MEKIKSSITRKVLVIFLLLTIGIVVTSFIATITGANYLLRDTTIDYTYQLVGEVENSVVDYQRSMQNIGEAIRDNVFIQDFIFNGANNDEECYDVLNFAASTRSDVTNIFIMSLEDGGQLNILCNDRTKVINQFAQYEETSWYKGLLKQGKSSILTSSYVQNLVEDQYNWVISQGMVMKDELGVVKGIILIDLNYSSIEAILDDVMPEEQGYIYLLSENEEIVYHPSQQLIFNKVRNEDTSVVANIHNNHTQIGDQVYVVLDSGLSKWKTVAVLDSTVVYRNTLVNTIIFIIIAFVFVLLSFYISYAFSNWFTKPIRNLSSKMKKVEQGDLSVRVDVNTEDEIGHLSESFNVMTAQIESLVDKILVEQEEKRNYELNALRSQINPHFLYNTLDSIIWMAECNQTDEVVEMTSALSKMLRASINNQKAGVTLGLEIQNVVNYLKIQKFRYSNKLDYELLIDEELYTRKAAHLVLQPLVENSIYHGVKGKDGTGKITIKAFEKDKLLYIQVIDDGVGMSQERIDEILRRDGKDPYGIGITNVNRRISLMYGEEYGLEIESQVSHGTIITIRIPSQDINTEGDDLYDNKYNET